MRFSPPTSTPSSIGDSYMLFKRSVIPVVPVVNEIVLEPIIEEGEVVEKEEEEQQQEQKDNSAQDGKIEENTEKNDNIEKDQNLKRKASTEEETSTSNEGSEEPENKKHKEEEESIIRRGKDADDIPATDGGGEVATVHSESNGDESKVGDESIGLPTKSESSDTEQETDEKSGSSEV